MKKPEGGKELKLDVGKLGKQNRRTKQMAKEVASGGQPTLEAMNKG